MKNSEEYNILLVGETGSGKSSLGNFIIGENVFEVSDNPESCTLNTIRKTSILDKTISIVDTPGLQDSQGRDKIHYDQMLEIIKKMKALHFILIVLNYTSPRFTFSIKYMIKFLCNVFPKKFSHHVGIVFTHYDHEYQLKINKKKGGDPKATHMNKYVPQIMELISQTTREESIQPPIYFLDSYVEDDNSKEERNLIMAFVKNLHPIEDIRANCNIKHKKSEVEYEERTKSEIVDNKIITYIQKYKREKYTDYNDNVTYSDWEYVSQEKKVRDIPVKVVEVIKEKIMEKEKEEKEEKKEGKNKDEKSTNDYSDLFWHCLWGFYNRDLQKEKAQAKNQKYGLGIMDFCDGWMKYDKWLHEKSEKKEK